MTEQDLDLEQRIDNAALQLAGAQTSEARREAWDLLQSLREQRTRERVEEMERDMGLS